MFANLLAKLSVKPLLFAVCALLLWVAGLHAYILIESNAHKAAITAVEGQRDLAEQERNTLREAFKTMGEANTTNVANVKALAQALKNQIGREQRTAQALAAADTALAAARAKAADYQRQLLAQRTSTYANDPTCAAWGRAAVCGAISGSVFDQWEAARGAGGNDRAGGQAGAAAGADPAPHDRRDPFAAPASTGHPVWGAGVPAARGLLRQPAAGGTAIVRPDLGAGLGRPTAGHPSGQ